MIRRYRRAVRRQHLAEAADLYPAYVDAHNRVAVVGCVVLSIVAFLIPVHIVVMVLP